MLYTRQPSVPPSYSGSTFRRRGDSDEAETVLERDAQDTASELNSAMGAEENTDKQEEICNPPPEKAERDEKEAVPASARPAGKRHSMLSRFGLDRLFGFDLEDLLILVLAFILLAEDSENDLLPVLLVLFFTGK